MVRRKGLWINGKIGVEFHDMKAVMREALNQGKRIFRSKSVYLVDLTPRPDFEGFYALVVLGGSEASGGKERESKKG